MKEVHRASERGKGEYGWLHTRYSFSFANYYNPKRLGFGALRVLNDDVVEPGTGFQTHAHDNMEIITIILEGEIEHKDSTGIHGKIPAGDVQVMSAGTGVAHSEFNPSKKDILRLLQIWVLPKKKGLRPRYDQKSFQNLEKNKIHTIVSGEKNPHILFINQDASLSLAMLEKGKSLSYSPKNALYIFVIVGEVEVEGEVLKERDALALSEINKVKIITKKESEVLLIDVPLDKK